MIEKLLAQKSNDIGTSEQAMREMEKQLDGFELRAIGVDDSMEEQA